MRQFSALVLLVLVTHTYSAPQFITWKDGKLGVNFGGYHAGIGIGGSGGTGGGLFAAAGTPHGQSAIAGLGGFGTKDGQYTGSLFAGANAAENVHASAGLGGYTGSNGFSAGNGFATAQAGGQAASSGMSGQSSPTGSTGYKFSGTQTFGIPSTVVKETEISALPVENKSEFTKNKKVHTEIKLEADNEIQRVPLSPVAEANIDAKVDIKANAQPTTVLVKEVYVEPQPQIIQKTKIRTHYKPTIHKTAYIGGYVGGNADVSPSYQPTQKRIDVNVEGSENVGVVDASAHGRGKGQTTYTKQVVVEKNPTFFADIFNIPIATLQAVGGFLSNSAANTKISVQKSASVQAEDSISSKHAPLSSSSSSSSDAHISVETPSVSKIIDDIFAIPISTLGAVNKFLENNVSARKRIQVQEGAGEPTRVRLGPHARRRANKQAIIVQQENNPEPNEAH